MKRDLPGDPDPLIPEGWESYTSPPETDDSGASLAYVVGAVAVVLAVIIGLLAMGWRP